MPLRSKREQNVFSIFSWVWGGLSLNRKLASCSNTVACIPQCIKHHRYWGPDGLRDPARDGLCSSLLCTAPIGTEFEIAGKCILNQLSLTFFFIAQTVQRSLLFFAVIRFFFLPRNRILLSKRPVFLHSLAEALLVTIEG